MDKKSNIDIKDSVINHSNITIEKHVHKHYRVLKKVNLPSKNSNSGYRIFLKNTDCDDGELISNFKDSWSTIWKFQIPVGIGYGFYKNVTPIILRLKNKSKKLVKGSFQLNIMSPDGCELKTVLRKGDIENFKNIPEQKLHKKPFSIMDVPVASSGDIIQLEILSCEVIDINESEVYIGGIRYNI
tara:strand:- start:60 stop:614 length:555 start_codon:yes stop_codon:yes gene_type:complete